MNLFQMNRPADESEQLRPVNTMNFTTILVEFSSNAIIQVQGEGSLHSRPNSNVIPNLMSFNAVSKKMQDGF